MNILLKTSLVSLLVSHLAYAKDEEKRLGNITVTANKIEENIQNVPQAISVIDESIIEEKGIKNISDVLKEIPNMTGIPTHGMSMNFRGLNTSQFTNNNPVVIYKDGVPTTDRYTFDVSMQNVERIEVLRGPQGTLYGKDAIGAVINIVTKKPDNTPKGSIGFEYGSYNKSTGFFNINTPLLKDILYLNFNAEFLLDDGWVTNKYNNDDKAAKKNDKNFAASIFYKIDDRWSTRLVIQRTKKKDYWTLGYGVFGATSLDSFNQNDAQNVNFDMPTYEDKTIDSQSLNLKYEADTYTLETIATHKKSDLNSIYDADFSTNSAIHYDGLSQFSYAKLKEYTGEIRLSNNADNGIRWIGGLYADYSKQRQGPYGMEFPYYNTSGTYLGQYMMDAHSTSKGKTQALFGQVIIPFAKQFEFTLGGRFQKITKDIDLDMYNVPVGTSISNATPAFHFEDERSWNTFLPKVALAYKFNEFFTPYISISKGYMPGGYNYFATSGTSNENSFEAQKSTNYEAGIKGTLQDVSFNASIFRMDIKDIHVYKSIGTGIYVTDNAKKAHSQGIELDFSYFPINEIELSAAIGFIDTKYDDYDAGSIKFDGKHIENTPTHTASISIAYYHPKGFYARSDLHNQGSTYFYDDANKQFLKRKGYTSVDLKLGYRFDAWDVYVYGKNLTDEDYITSFISSSLVSLASYSDPRTFGIGFKYKF
jgi:iron complex outermembrane recepter protein